jgi:glycosyltransferase involved in cell wall biosynthesis
MLQWKNGNRYGDVKMDVAFISFLYPNVDHTGGSKYTFHLCKALSKYVNVTVFIPAVGSLRKIDQVARHNLCKVLDFHLLRPLTFAMIVAQKIRKMNFDVIHSHCGAGIFLNKLSVETFHHRPSSVEALPELVCLKKAKHIIAVSHRTRRELIEMKFSEQKITVVNNGIDYMRFSPNFDAGSAFRKKLNIKEDARLILCIPSDGTKRKNLPLMLKTFRYLREKGKECFLLMVCSKRVKRKVLRLARKMNVLKGIYFFVDVGDEEMPIYYSASDFLAHPSSKEGFGFVLLEAVSSGKPFVSMNVGIASELARKNFGFVAKSEEDFMEKCLEMLDKPLRVGMRGNKFVKDNYSWDKCARKTVEVYKSLF